jgi:hypothetical protein
MNRYQSRKYEMFLRVREFGHAHRQLFPESSAAHKSFVALAAATDRIKTSTTAATLTAGDGRKTKTRLRDAILERMADIARTSRELTTTKDADVAFKLPPRGSDVRLLTTAQAFIRDSQAFKDEFVALDLPDQFDTELQELVDRFEHVAGGRRAGKARVKTAQAGLKAAMADASRAVRRLDVIVANRLKHDSVLLAVWKDERRVHVNGTLASGVTRPSAAPPVVVPAGASPQVGGGEPEAAPAVTGHATAPVVLVPDDGLRRVS